MQKISVLAGLTALLLTASLLRANALTVQFEVTPDNIRDQPYTFAFKSKDRDGLKKIGLTVTPKKGELSPGLSARLHLMDGSEALATLPLEATRDGNIVTYWFQMAPNLLAKSRFEFDVFSGVMEKLPDGKTRFVAEPGTLEYWFSLRDFIATKAALKPSRENGRTKFGIGKSFQAPAYASGAAKR